MASLANLIGIGNFLPVFNGQDPGTGQVPQDDNTPPASSDGGAEDLLSEEEAFADDDFSSEDEYATAGTEGGEGQSLYDAIAQAATGDSEDANGDGGSSAPDGESEDQDEKEAASQEDAADTENKEPADDAKPAEDLPDDPTQEELDGYKPATRRRIEKLLSQRNELRAEADFSRQIKGFMQENQIAQQDLDVVLGFSAQLSKGDYDGFLNTIRPYVTFALQMTGQSLPPDLREQVQAGKVSPEVAQELAQRRLQGQVQEQRAQHQTQAFQQERAQRQAESIRTAVNAWEDQITRSDPDFPKKAGTVRRFVQAMMQERGPAQTPQQALEYVQEAYREVNATLASVRPQPKATLPTPTGAQSGNPASAPRPNSLMAAMQQAVRTP